MSKYRLMTSKFDTTLGKLMASSEVRPDHYVEIALTTETGDYVDSNEFDRIISTGCGCCGHDADIDELRELIRLANAAKEAGL